MNLDALLDAVRADLGYAPDAALVFAGGPRVRFSTNGKRSDDSGWLRVFADGRGAVYGDWRRGVGGTWQAASEHPLSALDRQIQAREIELCKAERAAEDRKRHDEAAAVAVTCYRRAVPVARHAYLERKSVLPPSGVRGLQQDGRSGRFWTPTRACSGVERLRGFVLVIPMYDVDGRLRSLQAIDEAGRKSFLKGGRTVGLFFPIGARQIVDRAAYSGDVNVCEGLATAAAVHALSKMPTFAAFASGNLRPVAQAVRELYPRATIIVAGDVDRSGAGQHAASEAASAIGGLISLPPFTADELAAGMTDWNDWAIAQRATTQEAVAHVS